MKRVLGIAVLIAALVVGVTVAEAAGIRAPSIKKGTFTGKSNAGDPIGLKVNKAHKVYAFYYDGVRLNCTDGDSFDSPSGKDRIQTPADSVFPIENRQFALRLRNRQTGFGWEATGKFNSKGKKVTGTLKVHAKFNEQNQQDPNGSITCTSKNLTYTLNRK